MLGELEMVTGTVGGDSSSGELRRLDPSDCSPVGFRSHDCTAVSAADGVDGVRAGGGSDTLLTTHADYLRRRMADVGYSARVLFQELRRRQYAGSYETLKRFA